VTRTVSTVPSGCDQAICATTDPLVAERTVKNSLLLPADETTLAALVPLAEIAAKSIPITNRRREVGIG